MMIPRSDLLWAYLQSWQEMVGLARSTAGWLKGDSCTLKHLPAFPFSWPPLDSCSTESLPHQPALSSQMQPLTYKEPGGVSPTGTFSDVQAGLAWSFHSQSSKAADAHPYRQAAPCDTNLNVSPQKSSLLLIRMTGLAAKRRCKGLIEGTPDTHILANSWRGSVLRCKPSEFGNESMKSPWPETSQTQ